MASDDLILAKLADLNRGQQTMITGIQALTEAVDLQTKQLTAVNEWLREPPDKDGPSISQQIEALIISVDALAEIIRDRVR